MSPQFFYSNRAIAALLTLSAAVPLSAAPPSGPLQVQVVNTPLPVTGTVNTNITNSTLPITGTVQLDGTPSVRTALPSNPFFDRLVINAGDSKATGPATGTFAVTTLTFTNNGDAAQSVFVFKPTIPAGTNCDADVIGGSNPSLYMRLEPKQTAQLQFPTPLVINSSSSAACLAFSNTTQQVEVYVNGFTE